MTDPDPTKNPPPAAPGAPKSPKSGRGPQGESGGGAYPNPHSGKKPTEGGALDHGGQTVMDYHGPERNRPEGEDSNAVTRDEKDDALDDDGQETPSDS